MHACNCSDLTRFGKIVKLAAFKPFNSAANALEQINAVSESHLTDDLKNFLELNLPKVNRPTNDCMDMEATERRVDA
jgi:nucleolar protein 56